jgi:steroid 5-alpha reductase family enzyme
VVFVAGAAINLWSDNRLIALRADGNQGYAIPRGGLFERVSCPNHLGEIIEWWGFALMCWNLPALSFAVWTAANLIPRALSHQAWYRRTFADYPAGRKAVIPAVL